MLAWHFTNGMKLRDGTPLEAGRTYTVKPPLKICERGLHASVLALEALFYAPGTVVSRVRCGGLIVTEGDKLVCSKRTVLWTFDAGDVLMQFARECALDVLDLWDAPKIVREYLETGDETKALATYQAATALSRSFASGLLMDGADGVPGTARAAAAAAATSTSATATRWPRGEAAAPPDVVTRTRAAAVWAGTATAESVAAGPAASSRASRTARREAAYCLRPATSAARTAAAASRAASNATLESLLISAAIDFGYVDGSTLECR